MGASRACCLCVLRSLAVYKVAGAACWVVEMVPWRVATGTALFYVSASDDPVVAGGGCEACCWQRGWAAHENVSPNPC